MSKLMTIWRIEKGSNSAKSNRAQGSWPWHKKIHCVWIFLIFLIAFGFEFGIILIAVFFELCASGKLPIITDLIESVFLYYCKFHHVSIERDHKSLILTRIKYILVTKLDLNMIPFIWAVPWDWTEIPRHKFYPPDYSTLEVLYTSIFDSIHKNLGLSRDLNLKYVPVPFQFQVDGKLVNFDLITPFVSFMVVAIRTVLGILFIPFYLLGQFLYSYLWFANKSDYINFTMLLTLSLPMANCWILSSFGRNIGIKGAKFITFITLGLAVILSISGFHLIVLTTRFAWLNLGTWITSGDFNVDWSFMFDTLSVTMFFVVNTVSFVVHVYSFEYMKDDPHQIRFLALLSFFTAFMLILVSADNFLVLFFGWEGIGVCSYLLINFWFHRIQANKSSIKALLMNRVGDFALLLGIIWIFVVTKTVDFDSLFVILHLVASDVFLVLNTDYLYLQPLFCTWEWIALLLFIGAMGKSAQIGLHTWLPDAMEGPTPVSALIHAATLVTAGVYLILRCSRIFEIAENVSSLMVFVGSMTTFFAATAGLVQYDIKKVIAYSTCSQLGYMITSCGVNNYAASFFHLINHAFFKALLFLAAGAVIHGLGNEQDMRRMGGLRHIMPLTYVMILIGSLSLMGFPFFSGFYSKDIILESMFVKSSLHMWNNPLNLELGAYIFGTISAGLTAFYSFRLIYLVFISDASGHRVRMLSAHEMPFTMAAPLTILCFGSIFLGFGFKDMFTGTGTPIYSNSLVLSNTNVFCEGVPYIAKIAPVIISIISISAYWVLYVTNSFDSYLASDKNATTMQKVKKEVFNFLSLRWYFDIVQNLFIVKPILKLAFESLFKDLDKGLLHMFGPLGLIQMIRILFSSASNTSQKLSIVHNLLCSMLLLYLSIFFLSDIYLSFPNS